jgi:hypothetical protein
VQNAHNLILSPPLLPPHADHICPSPRQPGVRRRAPGKSPSPARRPPPALAPSIMPWELDLPLAPADVSVAAASLGSIRHDRGACTHRRISRCRWSGLHPPRHGSSSCRWTWCQLPPRRGQAHVAVGRSSFSILSPCSTHPSPIVLYSPLQRKALWKPHLRSRPSSSHI